MSRYVGRRLSALTLALGILAGITVALLGTSMLYVGATTTGDHPLDFVLPMFGMITILVSIGLFIAAWQVSRPKRPRPHTGPKAGP